jgi:hypothetical protein
MVLSFFTGADAVPPPGYQSVTVNFNNNPKITLPTASTCAVELTLPTGHTQYEGFKKAAFTMHGGFGLFVFCY